MPKIHRPKRGSLAFSPRKRAKKERVGFKTWPESSETKLLGFAGYKAGMTYIVFKDERKNSVTNGDSVFCPVTIIETPNIRVAGIRAYTKTYEGLKPLTEVWTTNLEEDVQRRTSIPKNKNIDDFTRIEDNLDRVSEIRAIVYTKPFLVKGVPKKSPDIMEIKIGGSDINDIFEYSKKILGKDLNIKDILSEGDFIDVSAVTVGKGIQGAVKRWGIITQNEKQGRGGKRRHIGNLGPWFPSRVRWTVPMAGQMGYHKRTEYNKEILKIGDKGSEITPAGGFVNYGIVNNPYIMVKGSIPGPNKRFIGIRTGIRINPNRQTILGSPIEYISLESQQ
ncbi:MAG TPA: 50S ribosomal protein L3 [Halobacteria archaeon]|jgi:large subunit ribosomal protein L3|nr:50S ribosomal protein L3 [Halobacteria archaeon]